MPSTKSEIETFIALAKLAILDGGDDPLHNAVQITALEKVTKGLRADPEIREMVCNELMKYERGTTEIGNGTKIEICETGVKYDYQDDHILNDLEEKKKAIDAKIKERQAMIKTLKASQFDQDGIEIKPAVRSSQTNYKITIK